MWWIIIYIILMIIGGVAGIFWDDAPAEGIVLGLLFAFILMIIFGLGGGVVCNGKDEYFVYEIEEQELVEINDHTMNFSLSSEENIICEYSYKLENGLIVNERYYWTKEQTIVEIPKNEQARVVTYTSEYKSNIKKHLFANLREERTIFYVQKDKVNFSDFQISNFKIAN